MLASFSEVASERFCARLRQSNQAPSTAIATASAPTDADTVNPSASSPSLGSRPALNGRY